MLFGGIYVTLVELLVVVVAVATMIGLPLLVYRTRFGRAMRATASDTDASYIVGIPVNRVIALTFAIGSGLAALAGILYCLAYGFAHPTMGFLPSLKALIAAVLGGIGSIPGAALGGVLLALVETFGAGYLPSGSAYKDAIGFGILVLLLYFRPQGILGRPELNESADGSLLGGRQGGKAAILIGKLGAIADRALPSPNYRNAALLAAAAAVMFLPISDYWLRVVIVALIYGMLATGLNVVVGFAGLLDLGYVAFWSVGAYFSSILFILVFKGAYGIDPSSVWWLFYVNLLAGGLLAAVFAAFVGFPTLRLRGDYLAIMTLGFGEIIRIVTTNWVGLTRGPMGIRGIPNPSLFGYPIDTPRTLGLLAVALCGLFLVITSRLVKSYVGRAWVAIRDNDGGGSHGHRHPALQVARLFDRRSDRRNGGRVLCPFPAVHQSLQLHAVRQHPAAHAHCAWRVGHLRGTFHWSVHLDHVPAGGAGVGDRSGLPGEPLCDTRTDPHRPHALSSPGDRRLGPAGACDVTMILAQDKSVLSCRGLTVRSGARRGARRRSRRAPPPSTR